MLRASRRASASGRPSASVNGNTLTLSAPPSPAENAATAPRMTLTKGSRTLKARQALSAWIRAARGAQAAGLDDPRPEQAQRAELRQGDELVGVRRQAKRDRRRRVVERKAVFAERAHIGERRRRARRRAPAPAFPRRRERSVRRRRERAGEALGFEKGREPGERRRLVFPRARGAPAARQGADGIEAEDEIERRRIGAAALDEAGEAGRLTLGFGAEIEFETERAVETHAFEGAVQGRRIAFAEAEAVGAAGSGEHDLQPVGAVGEVVERLFVRRGRVGMVEAGERAPGAALAAHRARTLAAAIERLQCDRVGGSRNEPVEGAAFERGLGRLAPIGLAVCGERARELRHAGLRAQMNCDRPGIAAEISPRTSSPAVSRA